MKEEMVLTGILLLLLASVGFVISDKVGVNQNKIVTLAVANQEFVNLAEYSTLEIEIDGELYFLHTLDVHYDRTKANFVLKSASDVNYIQRYFTLDIGPSSKINMYGEPEQIYFRAEKSKTIYIDGKERLYIELVSIKNHKANLMIKKLN